jgi:hypothetical protein
LHRGERYNITDYEGFVGYRKKMKLLRDYQAVIHKINEKEGKARLQGI